MARDGGIADVPDGYYHLRWNNFSAVDDGFAALSGLTKVATHDHASGSNLNGAAASFYSLTTDFSLDEADIAAAWNTGLTVRVSGYDDGALVAQQTFTLSEAPTHVKFKGFDSIDKVVFESWGGTDANAKDGGSGTAFGIEQIQLSGDVRQFDFEDAPLGRLADGYGDFRWSGLKVADDVWDAGNHALRLADGRTGTFAYMYEQFDLDHVRITAVHREDMTLTMQGWSDGTVVQTLTTKVGQSPVSPYFGEAWKHLDKVTITASGGTDATPGDGKDGTDLWIDEVYVHLNPPGATYDPYGGIA